jgi:hypothetical protein
LQCGCQLLIQLCNSAKLSGRVTERTDGAIRSFPHHWLFSNLVTDQIIVLSNQATQPPAGPAAAAGDYMQGTSMQLQAQTILT